ncbi:MAG: FAD-dependent oxidoreductase, partial [Moorea sp. SIO3G5]|nr:FAD-dependent oxidoreductase [Moorena sp. SIO3G5]
FANTLTTQIIELDLADRLTKQTVDQANLFYLTYNDGLAANIHNVYPCFGNGVVTSMKVLWDTLAGWSFSGPMMFNSLYLDPAARGRIRQGSGLFFLLAQRMQQLFVDWSAQSLRRVYFEYLDYLNFPFFKQVRLRNLKNKTEQELIDDHLASLELLEELAQAIFLLAVADTMPEQLAQFSSTEWLNAYGISLNATKWEQDGLFQPKSPPRDLRRVMEPMGQVFQVPEPIFNLGKNPPLKNETAAQTYV